MFDLLLIVAITGISIFVSYSLSDNVTWFDYYKGGVVGLFISGVIVLILNRSRARHEQRNKKTLYEIEKEKFDE